MIGQTNSEILESFINGEHIPRCNLAGCSAIGWLIRRLEIIAPDNVASSRVNALLRWSIQHHSTIIICSPTTPYDYSWESKYSQSRQRHGNGGQGSCRRRLSQIQSSQWGEYSVTSRVSTPFSSIALLIWGWSVQR